MKHQAILEAPFSRLACHESFYESLSSRHALNFDAISGNEWHTNPCEVISNSSRNVL
jgi:hypothetical protein